MLSSNPLSYARVYNLANMRMYENHVFSSIRSGGDAVFWPVRKKGKKFFIIEKKTLKVLPLTENINIRHDISIRFCSDRLENSHASDT